MTADLRAQLQAALAAAYTIERELGGGGMSRVFVATETTLGRKVVVKVLPPDLAAELSVERFRREIQVAAQLQNPHIVPLHAAGEGNGLLYYTMPYVDGESLRARLDRDGELPVAAALQVLRDVAKALAYAHRRGVVHRDIKPENILLSEGDALVADFGVAKALSASTTSGGGGLTSIGMTLGTPAYMAPEQAAGDAGVDARADLYALGAVAYELLTGSQLFPGRSPQALIAAHTTETPEAIERRRPNIPAPLASLVMRLLSKRPADRPQTADEVLRELDTVVSTGGTSLTTPSAPTAKRDLRNRRLLAAALILAAIGSVPFGLSRVAPRRIAPATSTPEASVAVLPFVNMSGDKENEYFADGMTEELIDRLANLRGLHVAARTSSFAFKGKDSDVREIGRQLGVHNVVEGSVRRAGSHVRVTAQLIDADSGYHRWSHTYDGDLKDVFAVQEQIGTAIAGELKLALAAHDSIALARAPTRDTLAHTLYLQARFLWNKRTGEALLHAVTLFDRAIARDPSYADAWGGLADCYAILASYADMSSAATLPKALSAADRALALDSTLASPRVARAHALMDSWRWAEAEREFRTAIALNPNYATGHQWFAGLLTATGRGREALIEADRAVALDPLSLVISTARGHALNMAGRVADAEAQLRATLERDPTFSYAWSELGLVLLRQHRPGEAIAALRKALAFEGEHSWAGYLGQLGYMYGATGQTDSARAVLRALRDTRTRRYVSPGAIAMVQVSLGQIDSAFASLETAIDTSDPFLAADNGFPVDPMYDVLRRDPRFQALLKRANLQ